MKRHHSPGMTNCSKKKKHEKKVLWPCLDARIRLSVSVFVTVQKEEFSIISKYRHMHEVLNIEIKI
jgi:hypothetical protein